MLTNRHLYALAVLTIVPLSAGTVRSQDITAGEEIYFTCAGCHGGDAQSVAIEQYPKLKGQNPAYLMNALRAYREGRRTGSYAAIMAETAKGMSDADIEDVVAYITSLE